MTNRKRGFTLIELLAVIVILAVIALIATPIIMNVINDSKKGAAKDSAYAIIKSAELEMSKDDFQAPVIYNEDNNLNYKGTKPSKMSLEIDPAGKTNLAAYIDGYCVLKDFTSTEVIIANDLNTESKCLASTKSNIIVDIKDGMIPVTYDESGNTVKANTSSNWYDYDSKKWANAVVVTSASRDEYLKARVGSPIKEDDILGYYVYIPRYRYLLWNTNNEAKPEQEIKIEFERRSTTKSNGTKNGEWLTHPAFTFGSSELNGIWVGKFEMTGTSSNPTIKPNQKSLNSVISGDQTTAGAFNTIKRMQNDTYGLSSYDSHMMKNMEWGAVAYLTNSKYGKCTNGTCSEVWINNVNTGSGATDIGITWDSSITGCAGRTVSAGSKNNMTACEEGLNYKQAGINASTTGNITGIYDMSGGSWDRMMSVILDSSGIPLYEFSGFNATTMPDKKYYDAYPLTTGNLDFSKGKLGDATREIMTSLNGGATGWYGDFSNMPVATSPWFHRGGFANFGANGGLFRLDRSNGASWTSLGSRSVLILE